MAKVFVVQKEREADVNFFNCLKDRKADLHFFKVDKDRNAKWNTSNSWIVKLG